MRVDLRYTLNTTCTCPYWMKRRTCKHALAHAINAGALIPQGCDHRRVVVKKRKRGPKAKMGAALVRDAPLAPIVPTCPVSKDYNETSFSEEEIKVLLGLVEDPAVGATTALRQADATSTLCSGGVVFTPAQQEAACP